MTPFYGQKKNAPAPHVPRVLGECWNTNAYTKTIRAACVRAGVDPWGSNRLRHTFGTEDTAEVYANETAACLLSIYDASVPYTYDPYTYPDNVSTANQAFMDGHYKQQMEFTLEETSDLRIGLRHFAPTVYDWACVDNFKLVYVKKKGTGIIDNGQLTIDNGVIYNLSGQQIVNGKSSNRKLPRGVYIVNGKKRVI